ncbi:hypothetical protein [Nitrosopumilus sp.]|uniref:hypothetical protein n=1 Tax=Nitrosopumilus sp. TaxID=2024843 RepID=UPI00260215EB|nr:hypothetical protein [Nitrosopumilus sp.]
MVQLEIYEHIEHMVQNNEKILLDLDDLAKFAHYKHGKEFLKIPSTIVGDKTILEWFAVDEISYWWFISPIIHSKFKESTILIERLFLFFDSYDITNVKIDSKLKNKKIIENFCKFKEIQYEVFSNNFKEKLISTSKNFVKKQGYKNITNKKIENRISIYNKFQKNTQFKKNSIIFTSPGIYRRSRYNIQKQEAENEEFFIQPLVDFLKKRFPILCIDLDYTFRGNTEILKERLETENHWIPIEILLKQKNVKKSKENLDRIKNQYKKFKENRLNDVFKYKEISFWEFLEEFVDEIFFEPNLPTYTNLLLEIEDFLKEIKPKMIIQVYETGPYAKAFELSAKKLGIKTVGIQHGLIPSDSGDYIFREIFNEKNKLGNIIPDITLVFGNYYKKLLTEIGTYPKDKVIEIGNPAYYNLDEIKHNLKKEELQEKYSIQNKKTVLIPLSFRFLYFKNNPDKILLDEIFEKFKNRDDIQFLIRTHPGDDFNLEELRKMYPTNNFLLSKHTLVEDFVLCDLVAILPISTVSTEAALFEKPIIMIDVINDKIQSKFNETYEELINSEIVKLVSIEKIDDAINSLKKDEIWRTDDSEKRKKFVENYFNENKKVDFEKILFDN